jgi:uncharacterized protein YggE
MKRRTLIYGTILVTIALLAGIGIALSDFAPAPAAAQEATTALRTVQTSGSGQVSLAPDQATVRLGVQTEAKEAQQAIADNSEQMTAVISATLESGIDESDVRTEGFRLQPMYDQPADGGPSTVSGYQVSNIVSITVRDLSQLGDLLDTVVVAGSNTIEGIQFEISNQVEAQDAAREAAMADAQRKAEQLTGLAGTSLGPVQTIVETGGAVPVAAEAPMVTAMAAGVPVQPGNQTVQASVQVTWQIQ